MSILKVISHHRVDGYRKLTSSRRFDDRDNSQTLIITVASTGARAAAVSCVAAIEPTWEVFPLQMEPDPHVVAELESITSAARVDDGGSMWEVWRVSDWD